MKSTHNTLWAYSKGAAATLAMVTGTAVLMAACAGVKPPPKEYVQDRLDEQIQVPAGNGRPHLLEGRSINQFTSRR
jgi:hypothetical protein